MECQYCQKVFTSKGNLVKHKKTNKRCSKIQEDTTGKTNLDIPVCVYCHKRFTRISKHNCRVESRQKEDDIVKLEKELKDKTAFIISQEIRIMELLEECETLKKQHESLTTALSNAQKEPKTIINNITNNITLNIIDYKQIEKRLLKTLTSKHPLLNA